jgi:GrpB-like predicted nucleotidyltransferase (UPF0157 family)
MKKLIHPYGRHFADIFKKKRAKISKLLKNIEIHHIGSTAVPNLGGKGIIDIMIGIKSWEELENTTKKLKTIGFKHVDFKEKGRVFLSEAEESKPGNAHIHIVKIGGKAYKELLFFRNYLRENKKEAKKLFNFKLKWAKETGENRIRYGRLKAIYVKNILVKNQ